MKKVDIVSDEELLKVIDGVVRIGYDRLQTTKLYRLGNVFYDREEFRNDLFLFIKSSCLLKRFDSSKSSLRTYIINYAMPRLIDKIIGRTGQNLYKSNYPEHKEKNKQVSITSLDKLNSDNETWDRLEAIPRTKLSNNLFYKKSVKVILNKMLKEHPRLTDREQEVFKKVIKLADTKGGYVKNICKTLGHHTLEKIRRFMKTQYNITKISDIPVNKLELY